MSDLSMKCLFAVQDAVQDKAQSSTSLDHAKIGAFNDGPRGLKHAEGSARFSEALSS